MKQHGRVVEYVKERGFGKVRLEDDSIVTFDRDVCRDVIFQGDAVRVELGPARRGGVKPVAMWRVRGARPAIDVALHGSAEVPVGNRDELRSLTVEIAAHLRIGTHGVVVFDLAGGDAAPTAIRLPPGEHPVVVARAGTDPAYIAIRSSQIDGLQWSTPRSIGSDSGTLLLACAEWLESRDKDRLDLATALDARAANQHELVSSLEDGRAALLLIDSAVTVVGNRHGVPAALVLDLGLIERDV